MLLGGAVLSREPAEAFFSLSEAGSLNFLGVLASLTIWRKSWPSSQKSAQTYKKSTYNLEVYTPSDIHPWVFQGFLESVLRPPMLGGAVCQFPEPSIWLLMIR